MAKKRPDVGKERFWREVFLRQAESGLSVRAFCQRENVAASAFYAWRKTIRQRDGEVQDREAQVGAVASEKSIASVRKKDVSQATAAFVPMVVADQGNVERAYRGEAITIELCGGRMLRLPVATSASRLAEIIHALEASGHDSETSEAPKTVAAEVVR